MKLLTTLLPGSKDESRKAQVFIIAAVFMTLGNRLGIDEATIEKILYLAMTYIGGQGLADMGKHKTPPLMGAPTKPTASTLTRPLPK